MNHALPSKHGVFFCFVGFDHHRYELVAFSGSERGEARGQVPFFELHSIRRRPFGGASSTRGKEYSFDALQAEKWS